MSMKRVGVALVLAATLSTVNFSIASDILGPLKAAEKVHVDVYRRFAPAVVAIRSEIPPRGRGASDFYYGTGIVISNDGLILSSVTAVPKNATKISVYFTDGSIREAKLEKFDEKSESVLIKVEARGLPYARLANSSEYQVGDPVYSWGNPHQIIESEGTVCVSIGSISGMYNASSVDYQSRYFGPVIETDAAINPGSDGGPLTDAEGNLLGIISLAYSKTRWLGLAIPTSRIIEELPELKPLTTAHRPTLNNGNLATTWATPRALTAASERAQRATMGLRVAREKDKGEVPQSLKTIEIKRVPALPIDNQQMAVANESQRPEGVTSAVCISPDGIILTSAFNVSEKGANPRTQARRTPPRGDQPKKEPAKPEDNKIKSIWVYAEDGERYEAKLLGYHSRLDLAVLKATLPAGKSLPFIDLQVNEGVVQGSSVAVLGRSEAPGTVTINCGRVSALHRERNYCVQISALINYGNLGGPVVDLDGRLIGIASHLNEQTDWRQNCGVGFMLMGSQIDGALAGLKAGKSVDSKAGMLGVRGDLSDNALGGRIEHVDGGSAADKAGIKLEDVIIGVNGKELRNWPEIRRQLRGLDAGDDVTIKVLRKGNEMEFKTKMGVRPEN